MSIQQKKRFTVIKLTATNAAKPYTKTINGAAVLMDKKELTKEINKFVLLKWNSKKHYSLIISID